MRTVAIDFETFYGPGYSVKGLSYWHYANDPRFKVTAIAICDQAGAKSWDDPRAVQWDRLHGARVVAHNAAFDEAVFTRLREQGIVPAAVQPAEWCCTAALAAYFQLPRALAEAAKIVLDVDLDKRIRDRSAGGDMFDDLAAYCLVDAKACFDLWLKLSPHWPVHEREVERLSRRMGQDGIGLDAEHARRAIDHLDAALEIDTALLPWAALGRPALSAEEFRSHCKRNNIQPPPSTAKTDEALDEWLETHRGTPAANLLKTMQQVRSNNRAKRVLETMLARQRESDRRLVYDLMYCGTTTGRWAGSGGLNMQNFNRRPVTADVDLRRTLIPAPGHLFVVADFAQIESRVLLWLAGETDTLDLLRSGIDLYEAHARRTMNYDDPRPLKAVNPHLRQLAKARVLALGYGCGASKFVWMANALSGVDVTPDEAKKAVNGYRRAMPEVVALWGRLEVAMAHAVGARAYKLPLPSGRCLHYWHPLREESGLTAEAPHGTRQDWYGGKLTENMVSATARDILADRWRELALDCGYKVVLSVHDELVFEVPEAIAEDCRRDIERVMATPPAWAADLPLAVEAHIAERYGK